MPLSLAHTLALALDPALLFEFRGLLADPWQEELLRSDADRILLNCCRQAGKSTTVAALALHTALFEPGSLILLVSRAQRQSSELFRKVLEFYAGLARPVKARAVTSLRLELINGSRIVSLPGREATVRSFSGVRLLIIDEAARVPDELYKAVRPMLAVSGGRLVCLSTPFGRRGCFYEAWQDQATPWLRFEVPANRVTRISPAFLDEERRTLGPSWYNQEYACSFEALEGLVYPDFLQCLVHETPELAGKQVGGIDFGFRNPFAAIWGVLDAADVLWLTSERYERQQPLNRHAAELPREVCWYADPAGAGEIAELRCGGFTIHKGDNALRAGIAAVTARLQTGRLKVLARACPNLVAEAKLYRYPSAAQGTVESENPVDEHNHALAALRYLVASIDRRFMVRFRRQSRPPVETVRPRPDWLNPRNEALWQAHP
jgi:hypothetical protein